MKSISVIAAGLAILVSTLIVCNASLASESGKAVLSKSKLEFIVSPYLVKPGTDTMTVMFEGFLFLPKVYFREKGETNFKTAQPKIQPLLPTLYRTKISGLKSNTLYEYYVSTFYGKTEIFTFKTWPAESDGTEEFKIAVISDTQGDHPERLADTIRNGIIGTEFGGSPEKTSKGLSALLITGDLVSDGNNKKQWENDFFANLQPLSSRVPLIAALGNHDMIPYHFACYFDLVPESGNLKDGIFFSRADILNLSILTLNTNDLVQINGVPDIGDLVQKTWTEAQLNEIGNDPTKNFVVAQFHHACKSEMWLPGQSKRACSYVETLEDFSANTGKPSMHLFGHTHAYSRGQSRDMTHIWINVAPAGGDIDYWGEYDMADYDEFQITRDEYGYSLITVTNGPSASINVTRRSGGDGSFYAGYTDETINDDFTVRIDALAPAKPFIFEPEAKASTSAQLSASPFSDADGSFHLETHWQISETEDFSGKVTDFWGNKTRKENIWFDQNIQAGVDITRFKAEGLKPDSRYYARVRYRDGNFVWSGWSEPVSFITEP